MRLHPIVVRLALLSAFLAAGDAARGAVPAWRYEPAPRPILAQAGVRDTWSPGLAFTQNGTLYVLAGVRQDGAGRLELYASPDGGDTFGAPLAVTPPGTNVLLQAENGPQFALDDQRHRFYALYGALGPDGGDLYVARRGVFGRDGFSTVKLSDAPAHAANGFGTLAVAANGDLYAAWLDGREGRKHDTYDVRVARSTDGGATFGPSVRIASEACPCCRPALAFGAGGTVFASWRRVFPGDLRDIVVAASHDGGTTWAPPVRVNADGWAIDGCPDSGSTMTTAGGRLFVAWFTLGRNGVPQVRAASSADGARFGKAGVVSAGVEDANHPKFVAGAPLPTLVFEGRDRSGGGWGRTHAFVARTVNGRWSAPSAVPGGARGMSGPVGAMRDATALFVAGASSEHGVSAVVLVRGRANAAAGR